MSRVTPRTVVHNSYNADAYTRREIENYNRQVERLQRISPAEQTVRFNKSKIGDWFFVSSVTETSRFSFGLGGVGTTSVAGGHRGAVSIPSQVIRRCRYNIRQVDVIAEDRVETEKHNIATYDDRFGEYFDSEGAIISKERVKDICDWYEKEGFEVTSGTKGLSVLAYIKDSKVVKVEYKE